MSDLNLEYREHLPVQPLRSFVLCYWEFVVQGDVGTPFVHHVMPDGCVSLVKPAVPVLTVVGPRLDELRVPVSGPSTTRGVRFWPGATDAILHVNGNTLRDAFGIIPNEIESQLPDDLIANLGECATLEAFAGTFDDALLPLITEAKPLDRIVSHCVADIMSEHGSTFISDLATRFGLSERQLQRRFRQQVGLTPKQFARIRRFRSSVEAVLDPAEQEWASVAYQHGFSDQAHLCREYAQLVGLRPEEFKDRIRSIAHVDVSP